MTQGAWVTSHPYLQPVASLEAQVNNEGAQREKSNNVLGAVGKGL